MHMEMPFCCFGIPFPSPSGLEANYLDFPGFCLSLISKLWRIYFFSDQDNCPLIVILSFAFIIVCTLVLLRCLFCRQSFRNNFQPAKWTTLTTEHTIYHCEWWSKTFHIGFSKCITILSKLNTYISQFFKPQNKP